MVYLPDSIHPEEVVAVIRDQGFSTSTVVAGVWGTQILMIFSVWKSLEKLALL